MRIGQRWPEAEMRKCEVIFCRALKPTVLGVGGSELDVMNNSKKRLLYFIYIIAITALFIYYLFPSDAVKKHLAFNFNKTNPNFNIKIDFIKPAFPPGLTLYNVSLYHLTDLLFDVKQIKIIPDLLSFFGTKTTFSFKGKAYEGILEGNGALIKKPGIKNMDGHKIIVKTKLYGINIKNISTIQRLAGREITGILDGSFLFNNRESTGTLRADIHISDCEVELLLPVFNLKSVTFTDIKTKAVINNEKIQVNECIVKGNQADGRISGSVNVKNPPGQSVLNLTGTIKPNQKFIENLQKSFPVKLLLKTGEGGLPIRLYGTIDQPCFSLK